MLASPSLGLSPLRTPEPVQGGCFAANVFGHLVELIGRHVEPVSRLSPFAGGILQDDVLTGGAPDSALHHLDETAHTVLLVDDVVPWP